MRGSLAKSSENSPVIDTVGARIFLSTPLQTWGPISYCWHLHLLSWGFPWSLEQALSTTTRPPRGQKCQWHYHLLGKASNSDRWTWSTDPPAPTLSGPTEEHGLHWLSAFPSGIKLKSPTTVTCLKMKSSLNYFFTPLQVLPRSASDKLIVLRSLCPTLCPPVWLQESRTGWHPYHRIYF